MSRRGWEPRPAPEKFRASMVSVQRVYEVICQHPECNGNVDSEFYRDRAEAVEGRRRHIEQHHRDDSLPPAGALQGLEGHREF